jgi:hypothetical protein
MPLATFNSGIAALICSVRFVHVVQKVVKTTDRIVGFVDDHSDEMSLKSE